jgi:hypothetical protein
MREDKWMKRLEPAFRLLIPLAATAVIASCASALPPDEASGPSGAGGGGCEAAVGRFADAGTPNWSPRPQTLGELLDLDPSTFDPVPLAERAVEVRHVKGGEYVLGVTKTTPPDAIVLWEVPMRCEGDELRFQSAARYETGEDGKVARQQRRFSLIADADGSLVIRRQDRERTLGLFDFRRGGDPVEFLRFPPLEPAKP